MVKDRLIQYLKFKRLGMREFARLCGVEVSVLSRISDATSQKTLRKIESNSDLNIDWLMNGAGNMLNDTKDSVNSPQTNREISNDIEGGGSIEIVNVGNGGTLDSPKRIYSDDRHVYEAEEIESVYQQANNYISELEEDIKRKASEIRELRARLEEKDKTIELLKQLLIRGNEH